MTQGRVSYVITAFAPEEIDRIVTKAKTKFDLFLNQPLTSKRGVITKNHAHITLQRSFFLKEGVEENELLAALEGINIPEFSIRAESWEVFQTQNHGNVVVALVEKTPELLNFVQNLNNRLQFLIFHPENEVRYEFRPHLSIGYKVPFDQLEEVGKYTAERILPLHFTLHNIDLLRSIPDVVGEREFVRKYK